MTLSLERTGLDHLIDRPALVSALDEALDSRLTLITAQAGAGKTSLLRQWSAAHADRDFVFLDFDSVDDDPAHFGQRLASALAVVDPDVTRIARSIASDDEGLGGTLIEALVAELDGMPDIAIIVDDVHRYSNARLVADLSRLVERLPTNVHLVLSSRLDPPIAVSRYRLDGELLEFRQAELAFNEIESAALLERVVGHSLDPAHVRTLVARTEGWAAGLQLAGLDLKHSEDPTGFIEEFGGNNRLVADYLGEEVLALLPADRRDLLLQMSALDEMCADLVQDAVGCGDAQGVLEQLERESMFVVPLDTRRKWFRFHHLFRDLLRSRLLAEDPNREVDILTAAANWHLTRGRAKTAVEYLLMAQAWGRALEVIHSNAADVVARGDISTIVRWMRRVPESAQFGRNNEELLAGVLQSIDDRSPRSELMTRLTSGDEGGSIAPGRESPSAIDALVSAGRAAFLADNMSEARQLLSRSLVAAGHDVNKRAAGLSTLSLVEAWCGNFEHASVLTRDAIVTARNAGMVAHASIADAYLALVLIALDRGEPTPPRDADNHLADAYFPGEDEAVPLATTVLFEHALAFLTRGERERARDIVSAWEELVPTPGPLSTVQRHILLAWLASSGGAAREGARQLRKAVQVAEIYGLVDVFVRAGPVILEELAAISGPHETFRDIILARAQQPPTPLPAPDLLDPLTDRELEILSYLPTRFTNVEVAARCFVSVNTIKTHMAHIYRKLDAANRDAAIDRARAVGLL